MIEFNGVSRLSCIALATTENWFQIKFVFLQTFSRHNIKQAFCLWLNENVQLTEDILLDRRRKKQAETGAWRGQQKWKSGGEKWSNTPRWRRKSTFSALFLLMSNNFCTFVAKKCFRFASEGKYSLRKSSIHCRPEGIDESHTQWKGQKEVSLCSTGHD